MKEKTVESEMQLSKDVLFYFPTSYEQRRTLHRNFFRQSYVYIFQIHILSFKIIGNKVFINASVFDKKITVIHSYKFAKFFRKGLKKICGSLKYEELQDTYDELYDPSKGDQYDNDSSLEEQLSDSKIDSSEYRWNRGWSHKRLPRIFCFFPEVFDLRMGIIAKYSKLTPLEVRKLKYFIENHSPICLRHCLLKIHEPGNIDELNESLNQLFVIEVACFLKYMSLKVHNEPMPYEPLYTLEFELTESQKKAVKDIYHELSDSCRMSRVLYGDVGSGKTIVAILSSLKCIANGKNVLYLVPTQLLAKQIKMNFEKFMPHVLTVLLTSNSGEFLDIKSPCVFIGTHALLWKNFKDVGLVIVDEQHKFGVDQRHTLTKDNNLLMMTATIIPRTFQMILLGNLSFSYLEKRKDNKTIETFIASSKEWHSIFIEILKNAQYQKIIWVSSTIEKAEKNYKLAEESEAVNVFILHGKTKNKDLILNSFDQCGNGILFSTTVIEVGIDIDINCIVIEDADKFGLAQLHQIRGRVGRRDEDGQCILIGDNVEKLYEIQRAKTGLEISKLDLNKRGFGLLQDKVQTGFENFIFARHWYERRWYTNPLNEEIISKAKVVPENLLLQEVCDLFFLGQPSDMKI